MPKTRIPTPEAFLEILSKAAAESTEGKRAYALAKAGAAVRELLDHLAAKRASFSKIDCDKAANRFKTHFATIIRSHPEDRKRAVKAAVALYGNLYRLLTLESGTVADAVQEAAFETVEAPAQVLCPEEIAKIETPPLRHIFVKKPGKEATPDTLAFSPDFARFLREKHSKDRPLIQLLSREVFDRWLDTTDGKKWLEDRALDAALWADKDKELYRAEVYRTALHQAFSLYQSDCYQQEHCRPQSIPMPGNQLGHRLLRLPKVFARTNVEGTVAFPDFVGDQLYRGPAERLEAMGLDLEELVRRYVNALPSTPMATYKLDEISVQDIAAYLAQRPDIPDPLELSALEEASKLAVRHAPLLDFIRRSQECGLDLSDGKLAEWLRGAGAAALKKEVIDKWSSASPGLFPGLHSGVFDALVPAVTFERLLFGLCAPELSSNPTAEGGGAAYVQNGGWGPIATLGSISATEKQDLDCAVEAISSRLEALVDLYDTGWRASRDRYGADRLQALGITKSGYEFKLYSAWLAVGLLRCGGVFQGVKPDGTGSFFQRADVANLLKDRVNTWNPLISEDDAFRKARPDNTATAWAADIFYGPLPASQTERDRLVVNRLLLELRDCYAAIVDALASFASASQVGAPATAAGATVQQDGLYVRWVSIFADLLRQRVAEHSVAKQRRLTLRLTPRRGRYGEVPKTGTDPGVLTSAPEGASVSAAPLLYKRRWPLAPEARVAKRLADQRLMPNHPYVRTEQYGLEPMPDVFACREFPTLYLREDLSLWIRHRGFGIGANLYSMSLFPEEEQVITIKSFKDTKVKTTESTAENIFEEQTDETAQDFATEMQNESERESSSQSEFNISGQASASFGFGSASIQSGYSSKASSRDLAKSTASVANKLASKLSAKRTVAVETKRQVETEITDHSELITERRIKNPNKGHTLTFHFFQMTRKLATELRLDDLRLVYTSGKHDWLVVYGNGRKPDHVEDRLFRYLPPDVGRKLPPDAVIVVCAPPYTEIVSLADANAFLTRIFKPQTAAEIAGLVWRTIGAGDPAPEGYAVAAFCGPRQFELQETCSYVSVTAPDPTKKEPQLPDTVAADEIHIKEGNESWYLPNIDLRYKRGDELAPSRYSADEFDSYSLPRTVLRLEHVINTNGVYCDAMIGRCSALEDYLEKHRDLDIRATQIDVEHKRIELGQKELEFRWELAKAGMVQIEVDKDDAILGIIRTATSAEKAEAGFDERLAVEKARQAELAAIHDEELEKKKLEAEIQKLEANAQQSGQPAKYEVKVPKDARVYVDLHLGQEQGSPATLDVAEDGGGDV